jgi:hypothetical protein
MFTTNYKGSFSHKAVSIISLFVLVVGVFPATASASGGDSCNQQFTYEKSGDFNDSRVTINFYDGDEKVDVSADSGYALVSVQYDLEGGSQSLVSWSFTGDSTTINPSGSVEVDDVRVVVKKVCPDLCPNISGEQYTVPGGMEVYNGQCVTPPSVTLTGASSCVAANGTYSITWTLTNNASDRQMQVTDLDFDGDNNLSGGNGDDEFDTDLNDPTFSPNLIPASGAATAVTNHDIDSGTVVQRIHADIDVRWQSSPSDNSPFGGASTGTIAITNYGTPCVPPPPVDVCANVDGIQTVTPCADTTCSTNGGTWTNNQCVMPVMVDICHKTGNDWNQTSVNENALSGHLGHGDFVIDAQNPCPPVEEPTEEEACEEAGNSWIGDDCYTPEEECEVLDEGFWNGTGCDDIAECDQDQTYNSSNNTCADPEPTEAEACVLAGDFWTGSTCVDVTVCTGDQTYNPENNTCADQDVPPTCAENQTLVEGQCVDNEITPTPEPETPKKKSKGLSKACGNNVDDDNDGLYDMNDPDCESTSDTSEAPAIGGTSEGDVLGASSCSAIITSYIGLSGIAADPEAVKVLQAFLNKELGLTLEVNGEYDAATIEAVKAFQAKYSLDVLSPWGINDATGIVYKTTQRMINKIACPTLDIPMPELN